MDMQIVQADAIVTEPLDVGPESKLHLTDIIAQAHGAPFTAGVCEVFAGAPVDFDYDDDAAVCYMRRARSRSPKAASRARSSQATWCTSRGRRTCSSISAPRATGASST